MKRRKIFVGCLGSAVVFGIFAAVVVVKTPEIRERGKQWVQSIIAAEQRLDDFERAWQPPAAVVDGGWFPGSVGSWRLERSRPMTEFSDLQIDRTGHHASYRSGVSSVQIDVIPATEEENAALIEKARGALISRHPPTPGSMNADGVRALSDNPASENRFHLEINDDERAQFWWLHGWLFVFRSSAGRGADTFPEEYLRAISTGTATAGERN